MLNSESSRKLVINTAHAWCFAARTRITRPTDSCSVHNYKTLPVLSFIPFPSCNTTTPAPILGQDSIQPSHLESPLHTLQSCSATHPTPDVSSWLSHSPFAPSCSLAMLGYGGHCAVSLTSGLVQCSSRAFHVQSFLFPSHSSLSVTCSVSSCWYVLGSSKVIFWSDRLLIQNPCSAHLNTSITMPPKVNPSDAAPASTDTVLSFLSAREQNIMLHSILTIPGFPNVGFQPFLPPSQITSLTSAINASSSPY